MNYLYISSKKVLKFDFTEINPGRFFPGLKLHRYGWREPRFEIVDRGGAKCLLVTIDNLTCDDIICDCLDASATACWAIGDERIELVQVDDLDESSGEVSIDSALRLGRRSQAVEAHYVHAGNSVVRSAVMVEGRDGNVRFTGGSPVDTWVPLESIRRITLGCGSGGISPAR